MLRAVANAGGTNRASEHLRLQFKAGVADPVPGLCSRRFAMRRACVQYGARFLDGTPIHTRTRQLADKS